MKQERERRVLSTLAQVCGALAAGFGFVALLGWILNLPLLSSFGTLLIPMAPSTALLFGLLGGAAFSCTRWSESRAARRAGLGIGVLGAFASLFLLILSSQGIYLEAEHLGFPITGSLDGAPFGHMSPVTAFLFLLASTSFLLSLSTVSDRLRQALAAFGIAFCIVLASYVLILAYFYGLPLLYGGDTIPPALPTSLAFLALGIGLLARARAQTRPLGKNADALSSRVPYTLILVFVILSLSIATIGYLSYRNYEQQFRGEVERQLSAIAELKINDLEEWRTERLGDGEVIHHDPASAALVQRYLEDPEDSQAEGEIRTWLESFQTYGQYDRVRLLDTQGVMHLSVPAGLPPVSSAVIQAIPDVLQTGQPTLVDFYRNEDDQRIYMSLLIPIVDEMAGNRIVGLVAMRIDPEIHLYPYISEWPIPSTTAETLLVRRDGEDALSLNELRFAENTALTLRIPLADEDNPAVKAVLGYEGIVEGVDYRGEQVIADVEAVPNSPWYLVARMDTAEVYAPLQERLWQTALFFGMLFASIGAGLVLFWRQQRIRFYRERYEAAEALRESEERFRTLYENATIGIYRTTPDGHILLANPALISMLGYESFEELSQRDLTAEVYEPGYPRQEFQERIERDGEVRGMEAAWKRRDNSVIFVRESAHVARNKDNQPLYYEGTVEDITERKQAEIVRQVLLEIMQGAAASEELQGYLRLAHQAIGRVIYAENFFVALYDHKTGLFEEIYTEDKYDPTTTPYEMGKSVSAYVFRTQEPLLLTQEHFSELIAMGEVELVGINSPSWLGVPLKASGETIGVMVVQDYEKAERYSENDKEMLASIAGQVALAIKRKRAEEALKESEERFSTAFFTSPVSQSIITQGSNEILAVNDACCRLFGYSREEIIGASTAKLSLWENPADRLAAVEELQRTGHLLPREATVRVKSGEQRTVIVAIEPISWQGHPCLISSVFDITDRKQAEEEIRRLNAELEQRVEERTRELREAQEQLVRHERLAMLGQLAGSIGHELRNPLGVISNAVYFLKMAQPDADDRVKEYLGIIENETRTSDKIVTDLLDFTRIKSVDPKPASVPELVSQTLQRFPAPESVDVVLEIAPDLPQVYADPHHVVQVLGNLVTNAFQAMSSSTWQGQASSARTPEGGKLTISAVAQSGMIKIAVQDTGEGIPPENINKLFEPLFTTKARGIGLGLAVSRKLAETNGGRIEVQSEPGKGSTFIVYWPVYEVVSAPARDKESK
ncbi:MAG: PAS domain S-box protein [Chloroflexi bacterium]|nr:PAS domain S-box protein [Chloroflexota bacterium]